MATSGASGSRRQRHLGPAVVVVLGEDLAVERAGQVAADGVQQRLNALVPIGRADHHRADLLRRSCPRGSSCGSGRSGPRLSSSSSSMISSESIESASSIPCRARSAASVMLGRDRLAADVLAVVAVEVDRLAVDQVDHALKARLGADRESGAEWPSGPACSRAAGSRWRGWPRCGPSC